MATASEDNPQDIGKKRPAVLCILQADDKFLLLLRNRQPNRGLYTPVGGKINPFESPVQAAIRETHEETGISLKNPQYRGTLVETSPVEYNWICFCLLGFGEVHCGPVL